MSWFRGSGCPATPVITSGTLANGRVREQVMVHCWWPRIDDSESRPYRRPRVDPDVEVHDGRFP